MGDTPDIPHLVPSRVAFTRTCVIPSTKISVTDGHNFGVHNASMKLGVHYDVQYSVRQKLLSYRRTGADVLGPRWCWSPTLGGISFSNVNMGTAWRDGGLQE